MEDHQHLYLNLHQDLRLQTQFYTNDQTQQSHTDFHRSNDKHNWNQALTRGTILYSQMHSPKAPPSPFHSLTSLDRWGWTLDTKAFSRSQTTWPDLSRLLSRVGFIPIINDTTGPNTVIEHVQSKDFLDLCEQRHPATMASFGQLINPAEGLIVAYDNISPTQNIKHTQETAVPELKFWSDVAFLQWCLRADLARDELRFVLRYQVLNDVTLSIVNTVTRRTGMELRAWPGCEYAAESEEGRALLGCPNGVGVGRLLSEHKEDLGQRVVEKVTLFEWGGRRRRNRDVGMLFHIKGIDR